MPCFTFYDGTSAGTEWSTASLTANQIQQEFEEYQYQREREHQMWEQQLAEQQAQMYEGRRLAEELKEDKRKYPLFFLKDGIV